MRIRRWAVVATFVTTALFGAPAIAEAKTIKPGDTCLTVGSIAKDKKGETYRCETKNHETCPHWHWVYNPNTPKGQKPASPQPCETCKTPSTAPSPSVHSTKPVPSASISKTPNTTTNTPNTPSPTVGHHGPSLNSTPSIMVHPSSAVPVHTASNGSTMLATTGVDIIPFIVFGILLILGGAAFYRYYR